MARKLLDISGKEMRTIAVDLTPVLPGGENGGAKIFVLELLRRLASMHPETQFVLLTQAASHEELAWLDSSNLTRWRIGGSASTPLVATSLVRLPGRLKTCIPGRVHRLAVRIKKRLTAKFNGLRSESVVTELHADLLFCPFTAPTYAVAGIPTVCTIYDLQYKTYPEFFSPEDVAHRDRTFQDACRHATLLTAISDYSRETSLNHSSLSPNRIRTIYLRMAHWFDRDASQGADVLANFGLAAKRYLIFPANFWKHKNHEMLFTAFGMACRKGLDSDIKLVCTGAPGDRQRYLANAVQAMDLQGRIIFPGFMPSEDLATLMLNACGLIFPSLYEGFGLPVIEAMAIGIPVACSNTTSLPEVAAGAAILFNPRAPEQIAEAIISLVSDQIRRNQLITNGLLRSKEFADVDRMVCEYWQLFHDALHIEDYDELLTGIYEDGWCGPRVTVRLRPIESISTLQIDLFAPEWLPSTTVRIRTYLNGKKQVGKEVTLSKGITESLYLNLPNGSKLLEMQIYPIFVPTVGSESTDSRQLTVMIQRCALEREDGSLKVLYPTPENTSNTESPNS